MTDQELRDLAVAELKLTTAGWRKPNGQPNYPSGEAPMSTHWGKAMDYLEQIGAPAPPPPPPPPPPTSKPTIPTGFTAVPSGTTAVQLNWAANPSTQNVDAYQVYMDDNTVNLNVIGTSFLVTGLAAGSTHTFRVSAHNSAGYGDWGNAISVTLGSPPPPPPPPTGTRDAAYWPFTSTSPWNHPIGSGATFAVETSPLWQPSGGVNINQDNGWSIPVFIAKSTDPMVDVYSGNGFVVRMRVPTNAAPASQSDAHMAVISDDRQILLETFGGLSRPSPDRINAPTVAPLNSPKDAGVYPGQGWHGTRAYGGSSIGGLIRKHEIAEFLIPHALAMAVDRPALNRNTPNGQAYVWPASNADSGWQTSYGSSGNLHMGSLLAIPPSVNLGSLGLSPLALAVARAWQDYGGYICDCTTVGSGCVLYAEPGSGGFDSTTRAGIAQAASFLQVVTNNTPTTTGGGGTPRKPFAPAFQ